MLFHELKNFINSLFENKKIIYDLAKRRYQKQYSGSVLGFVWVYLQPLIFIAVLYFIFTYAFDRKSEDGIPFSVWLISGMIAWQFFANNFTSGSGIINEHNYLVKKINFQLNTLPLVVLLSSYLPHLALIIIALIIAVFSGVGLTLYVFQLFYYLIAMSFLLMGINWLTSSTNIFISDVNKIVGVFVQLGFWGTPILWRAERLPEEYQWMINLNPMTYIVTGYRDSIIYQIGFWQKPYETIYFWVVTLILCVFGAVVFKRLRPHFAEVI